MQAQALFKEGKLDEAVETLNTWLRDHPEDSRSRVFLFELLCFQGAYERAQKHLALLAEGGKDAALGALLFESAIHAERLRETMFDSDDYPVALAEEASKVKGALNGSPFSSLCDADPHIGPRLELFSAGTYLWIPFSEIASVTITPPKRLRDLIWTPATVRLQRGFDHGELGELLIPALSALTPRHPDAQVRLGRLTEWCRDEKGRERPYGQKMILVDGVEFPVLEIRQLEIAPPAANS